MEILGLLQALPEDVSVKACYLVGFFKNDLGWDALNELFLEPFEFKKIAQKSREFYFIHSDNDPYCPLSHAKYLHSELGGDLIVLPGQKHFSITAGGEEYRQFPYLLTLILGNAVDVLLEEQTRPHADIDIIIQKKDVIPLKDYLLKQELS